MERIIRIYVEGMENSRKCLAFDLEKFVSFNVDTRVLQLENGCHIVCEDSVPGLIRAYRTLAMPEINILGFAEEEEDAPKKRWWEVWK